MPELPEVETTRRGLAPHLENKKVLAVTIRQPALRWPVSPGLDDRLINHKLRRINRRGKYLLFDFGDSHLLIHLGMSGSLRIAAAGEPLKKHDHAEITFSGPRFLRFHDPRRFGAILHITGDPHQHSLLNKLGPEPLSESFTGDHLFQCSRKRTRAVKEFIMDSRIVVGVGNIYANEALFHAGIRPTRAAGKVTRKQFDALTGAIKQVLQRSIDQGGTTVRDFVGGDGNPGYFAQQLSVYGRQGEVCKQCDQTLKAIRQSQRISVYCARCQR